MVDDITRKPNPATTRLNDTDVYRLAVFVWKPLSLTCKFLDKGITTVCNFGKRMRQNKRGRKN